MRTAPMPFEVDVSEVDDTVVLTVSGDADIATAQRIDAAAEKAARTGARALVLDLTRCAFMDPSGLNALLRAREIFTDGERRLLVACPPDGEVARLLTLTVGPLLERFPTRAATLAAARHP